MPLPWITHKVNLHRIKSDRASLSFRRNKLKRDDGDLMTTSGGKIVSSTDVQTEPDDHEVPGGRLLANLLFGRLNL